MCRFSPLVSPVGDRASALHTSGNGSHPPTVVGEWPPSYSCRRVAATACCVPLTARGFERQQAASIRRDSCSSGWVDPRAVRGAATLRIHLRGVVQVGGQHRHPPPTAARTCAEPGKKPCFGELVQLNDRPAFPLELLVYCQLFDLALETPSASPVLWRPRRPPVRDRRWRSLWRLQRFHGALRPLSNIK